MADPVVLPINQFSDADGHPYAGGTIATYIPGTSTPKATYLDAALTAANPNPVILDAAGRATMYADGQVRLILRDAVGNEVWDVVGTSIISAAMAPVVEAATIAEALDLLGVSDLIAAEALARSNADSTEQTARINAIAVEQAARETGDTDLYNGIVAEQTRALAAEAALAGGSLSGGSRYAHVAGPNVIQWGPGTATGGTGVATVTFPIAFPAACQAVIAICSANALNLTIRVTAVTTTTFTVFIEDTNNTGGKDSAFYWAAFGA
jgi:hypothetical protein